MLKLKTKLEAYLEIDPQKKRIYENIRQKASKIFISGYDITKKCNLKCEGCFFFEGELSTKYEEPDSLEKYESFFQDEKKRGITFPHFAGAEPAMVQDRLRVASSVWNQGLVYTNGTIKIDSDIHFMLHISLWGDAKTDKLLRGSNVFKRAVKNYKNDNRVVFVYTINALNIDFIKSVVQQCSDHGMRITFNHFSPSKQYLSKLNNNEQSWSDTFRLSRPEYNLLLSETELKKIKDIVQKSRETYPATVIYSDYYNQWINNANSRFDIDSTTGIAKDCVVLNKPYHRQYHTDFSYSDNECCIANTDCLHCRHYVSGYTKIMNSLKSHLKNQNSFFNWLDVYNTWCKLHFIDWD